MGKQDRALVPTAAEVTPVIIKRADLKGAMRNRKVQKAQKKTLVTSSRNRRFKRTRSRLQWVSERKNSLILTHYRFRGKESKAQKLTNRE